MPFLDDFAQGFNSTFNTAMSRKSERERLGETQRQFDQTYELQKKEDERAAAAEGREAERHQYEIQDRPGVAAAREAEAARARQAAALLEQQAIEAKWNNDPEQRELQTQETKANIEKLKADGKLTDAQAEHWLAELPYAAAKVKASIDYTLAQTAGLDADTAKKWADLEIQYMTTTDPKRRRHDELVSKYGLPPPAAGFEGPAAPDAETAIPVQGAPLTTGPTPPTGAALAGLSAPIDPTAVPPVAGAPMPATPVARPAATAAIPETGAPATGPTAGPATRSTETPVTPTGRTLDDYRRMSRQELAALPPEEYNRFIQMDWDATGQPAQAPSTTPTPGEMPRTPLAGEPPPARIPQGRPPTRAPTPRPDTPQQPLDNTYRASPGEMPSTTPRPMYDPEATSDDKFPYATRDFTRTSARPGEGRVIEAQAGTRKLPLSERTRGMLDQASAATGYTVRVTSGGQPSSGSNRTGSHRHDVDPDNPDADIGAGDIQLIDEATGEPVTMETPEGQQRIIEFMRAARDAGATGFGAGVDYMGADTIHVGFGDPGVWGAGGKRANAPDWLVAGMEGGVGGRPSAIPQGTGSRPAGVARAYQGLQQRDMPQMQAAVLAGNIQQESSGNPNSVNEAEGAEGIIQWRQDRLDKLKAFASEQGTDYRDLDTQLDFLIEEGENRGSGQDKAAWQEFMSATTPEAANAALKKFIRYGDESAGTRLEYAENLLRSGGGEITGERLSTERVGERGRMPTPRGEITSNVRRQNIVTTNKTAVKEGLKAIYAGLETQPGIPTQDRTQQLRNVVANKDAAPPAELANAREAVQRVTKEPISETEMNAAILAYAYDMALIDGDKDKAALVAKEILQTYTNVANQYASLAKIVAETDLDKAAQLMAKADAYVPNGEETKVTKDEQGNYIITSKDLATGKLVQQQALSPNDMMAGIMGWKGTTDVHRRLRKAAGEAVPSEAYEQYSGAAQQVTSMTQEQMPLGQALPELPTPDTSQMTEEGEGNLALGLYREQAKKAEASRTALKPPPAWTPGEKAQFTQEYLGAIGEGGAGNMETGEVAGPAVPAEVMNDLKKVYAGQEQALQATVFELAKYNPDVPVQNIINGMHKMLTPQAAADPNRGPQSTYSTRVDREHGTMIVEPVNSGVSLVMDPRTYTELSNLATAQAQAKGAETRTTFKTAQDKVEQAKQDAARKAAATAGTYAPRLPQPLQPRGGEPIPPWMRNIPEQLGIGAPGGGRARPGAARPSGGAGSRSGIPVREPDFALRRWRQ